MYSTILCEPSPGVWKMRKIEKPKFKNPKIQKFKFHIRNRFLTHIRSTKNNAAILPSFIFGNFAHDEFIYDRIETLHEFGARRNAIRIERMRLFRCHSKSDATKTNTFEKWNSNRSCQWKNYRRCRCLFHLARGATPSIDKNNNFAGRIKRYKVSMAVRVRSKISASTSQGWSFVLHSWFGTMLWIKKFISM